MCGQFWVIENEEILGKGRMDDEFGTLECMLNGGEMLNVYFLV